MPPIHEYSNWAHRQSDALEQVDPLRKYVFVCEGTNSEVFYFRRLIDEYRKLDLHPLVDMVLWERTGNDRGLTTPLALLRFANREKDNEELGFRKELDRMVIVCDLDVYCRVGNGRKSNEHTRLVFNDLLSEISENDILAVTNPSFELFLLLHKKGAYKELVEPHATELIENKKKNGKRYAQRLFTDHYHINPKSNPAVGDLVNSINLAIHEERNLNQEIEGCLDVLTCNVGRTIELIRNDRLEV